MILTRFFYGNDRTIGKLVHKGFEAWTIEPPHLANKPSESCIPEGEYRLERYDSPRFGDNSWKVEGADGRTFIAIHTANYARQLEGCIALGYELSKDLRHIARSREAIDDFYAATEGESQMLIRIVRGAAWD